MFNIPTAFAQQQIPANVDPSRFQNPLERLEKTETNNVIIKEKKSIVQTDIPKDAENYFFKLEKIEITGVTALKQETISTFYYESIGKEVSVADIYKIANKITQAYRDKGYILANANIPPQEIENGLVKIEVVEGNIAEVRLEGLDTEPSSLIKDITQKAKQSTAFNVHALERQILLLNRATGLQTVGILEPLSHPDLAPPGAIALKFLFSKKDNQCLVSLDNSGSKFVGPWQLGTSIRIPHSTLVHGITDISVYTTPQIEELGFFSIAETMPISSDGLTLKGEMKFSRSEPGSNLQDLDLNSRYLSLSAELEYPLILLRNHNLNLFGRFEYNNSESDILNTRFYEDRLRILRAGVRGEHNNFLNGYLSGEFIFSQGIDILNMRKTGSTDLSRAEGHTNFNKIEANVSYSKALSSTFSLTANISGQYSPDPLLSSEEFGYGGTEQGKAYNSSEITGDSGASASIELFYHGLSNPKEKWQPYITPFVFYDIGKVWNKDNGVDPESGSSIGIGANLQWNNNTHLQLSIAQPLTRSIENPSYGNGKNPRFLISLRKKF